MHNLFTSCIMAPCQSISSMRDNPGKPTTNIILREKTLNLLYTYNIGKLKERLSMDECSNGDQTIILGLQIVLDRRLLSSIGQKILMILPPPFSILVVHWRSSTYRSLSLTLSQGRPRRVSARWLGGVWGTFSLKSGSGLRNLCHPHPPGLFFWHTGLLQHWGYLETLHLGEHHL